MSTPLHDPRAGSRPLRRIVFDEVAIAARVRALGQEITRAYPEGDLLLVGLLKGSFVFLADLVRNIERPLAVDFLVASSYGTRTVSSGEVRLLYEPASRLADRHILLVEDIIDSGRTLASLMDRLRSRGPRSLAVCALLDKRIAPPLPELRFVGFTAPPAFLVGYGLDHAEDFRHLPYIAEMG
ncbi:MAG: hypoxanthine phosphoribosyltransferase [Gemmatimonadetes bacterium]|nr:hypoxanthine phosphoribosyltransferase [Gemmatimonadota bacterium]MBK7714510.1 hypoxanthine phosphoribosyltransferase [Gemmatimonadota bacterium]